jgi:DNA-binding response OmpR family regulator
MNTFESYSGPRSVPGATAPAVTNHTKSPGIPVSILVADDVPGVLEIITAVLARVGYQVTGAEDGEMAWDALCAGRFDLLITDHDMPRLTGMELLRRMRAVPFGTPVILMSGRIPYEEADLFELLQPGMVLAKPFSFGDLLANVSRALAEAPRAMASNDGHRLDNFEPSSSAPTDETWQRPEDRTQSFVRRLIGAN